MGYEGLRHVSRLHRSAGAYLVTSTCPLAEKDEPAFTNVMTSFCLNFWPARQTPHERCQEQALGSKPIGSTLSGKRQRVEPVMAWINAKDPSFETFRHLDPITGSTLRQFLGNFQTQLATP